MLDFFEVSVEHPKKGVTEIEPSFITDPPSKDLMIRGGDFYAIWDEDSQLWSTDEGTAIRLIDRELKQFKSMYEKEHPDEFINVKYMKYAKTGMIDKWHKFVQHQLRDSFHTLDEKIIFSNVDTKKRDYASKKLDYALEEMPIPAYDELIGILYSPEERTKIEWAVGAVLSGESKKIQKFLVMYGAPKTGKSTILNIIEDLFGGHDEDGAPKGYWTAFDSKALGSASNQFSFEAFVSNPLVAIQHDGDLSKIEDNTRLNSLISHETVMVNVKNKSAYPNRFKTFLFMGTNKPVKISDAKSGIIRRLIDVSPSGAKIPRSRYDELTKQVKFELGGIAWHCKQVFEEYPGRYDDYIPTQMIGASNDFYNYVLDSYEVFEREDGVTLKAAWEMYNQYNEQAKVLYPYPQRQFKEELKNYFKEFVDRTTLEDGTRVWNYYQGFILDKFEYKNAPKEEKKRTGLIFDSTVSIFDSEMADYPAQYANQYETPNKKWSEVETKLVDLRTNELHYVKVPKNHIVIDFDIKDKDGNKSFELNSKAASKFPPTYAELSKSGSGIHLHYNYIGDVTQLSKLYDTDIEVKVFNGNSSLRRKLTRCNNLPIASISSGLPLKEAKPMINFEGVATEKSLRKSIEKALRKEVWPNTTPSVSFIKKALDDAYNSGMHYDVSDLQNAVFLFAAQSSHQKDYCMDAVMQMHFKSDEPSENKEYTYSETEEPLLIFYDVEVFPNLFVIVYKAKGKQPVELINPTSERVEALLKNKLVGFNCRRYDNHILYGRLLGYTNEELFNLSKNLINNRKDAMFGEAYNLSYTDIYDFASADNKMSLKKLEIKMDIHHQELGLPWDKPVPKELWQKVADYCINDVVATEAAFEYLKSDWTARQILADVAGMTVNDTTNMLTTRIIFEGNKSPQSEFNYRFMGEAESGKSTSTPTELYYPGEEIQYNLFQDGKPIFPGYKYDCGKSTYRDICPDNPDTKRQSVGEGGFVYAEPGMYTNIALLDVQSMHPSSIIAENLFGDRYTARFKEIKDARIAIKHGNYEEAGKMLGGKLAKHLTDKDSTKSLAKALKTAINSVYGLTSASFPNPFRDPRNKDNIVAKRGALFMINLKNEVQKRGFTVAHIKTDSIKIPNATPEIIKFVCDYGKMYGYIFEHEATYDRMCLVNDAVYIAKYATVERCEELYGAEYVNSDPDICGDCKKHGGEWTATGTQFAVPYVFKTLFSHEPVVFKDKCEVKSVTSALYLDMNEQGELPFDNGSGSDEYHDYHFVGKVGEFCPIKPGCGGGLLVRESTDKEGNVKYGSATGAKGYRWLESETVKILGKENDIDETYYKKLVDDAVDAISQYGDYEWFVSGDTMPVGD